MLWLQCKLHSIGTALFYCALRLGRFQHLCLNYDIFSVNLPVFVPGFILHAPPLNVVRLLVLSLYSSIFF